MATRLDAAVLSLSVLVAAKFLTECISPKGSTKIEGLETEHRRRTVSFAKNMDVNHEVEEKTDEIGLRLSPSSKQTENDQASDTERAQLENILVSSFAIQSIKLGDQLGLYVALFEGQSQARGGISLEELCALAKTDSRLTAEWLKLQDQLSFVLVSKDEKGNALYILPLKYARYLLPPSYSASSMTGALRLASCMIDLSSVVESFETGQQTLFKPEEIPDVKFNENLGASKSVENRIRYARESYCTKFFLEKFVDEVLLQIEGGQFIVDRLLRGEIDVAETYCGTTSGTLSITLASTFRNARFIGFDNSHVSLTRARDLAHAAGTKNTRFYDVRERSLSLGPPPSKSKNRVVKKGYGLVLSFLSLSMISIQDQQALFREVKAGLDEDGGKWIIMDLDADGDSVARAICGGMSLLHYLPSLQAPETCSTINSATCRRLADEAGFSSFAELPPIVDEMLVRVRAWILA